MLQFAKCPFRDQSHTWILDGLAFSSIMSHSDKYSSVTTGITELMRSGTSDSLNDVFRISAVTT